MHEGKVKSKIEFIHIRGLFMSSKVEVLIVLFVWSNFCCNRNFNRNFLLCLLLIFASSFMDRYILYSALLRKSNIDELQMLNYYLRQAEKKIKTSKINTTENFCYNFCYNRNWTTWKGLNWGKTVHIF